MGVSFDVQSMRYTGERICRAARGEVELEEVFYLRPVGQYSDRQGKKYSYTAEQRAVDLEICAAAAQRYATLLEEGFAEEHARGILPFDYRQHFVVSFSLRALLHFLDLRAKLDAQQEIRALCDLLWPHLQAWAPEFADWYARSRCTAPGWPPDLRRFPLPLSRPCRAASPPAAPPALAAIALAAAGAIAPGPATAQMLLDAAAAGSAQGALQQQGSTGYGQTLNQVRGSLASSSASTAPSTRRPRPGWPHRRRTGGPPTRRRRPPAAW